jgi:hypothetical protein
LPPWPACSWESSLLLHLLAEGTPAVDIMASFQVGRLVALTFILDISEIGVGEYIRGCPMLLF